jgi:hypothetical protein
VGDGQATGGSERWAYSDVAWLCGGLAVTACTFVTTGSAAAEAMVMLGYLLASAAISGRHRPIVPGARRWGRRDYALQILCLVAVGVGVYVAQRHAVQNAVGPWFTWWLAIGSSIVLLRRWQRGNEMTREQSS